MQRYEKMIIFAKKTKRYETIRIVGGASLHDNKHN